MYDNFQQPSYQQLGSSGPYAQPIYSNQYEQIPYANNAYMNQQVQPSYETALSQPPPYSISTQQQFPPQPQYVDNTYMNQQSQPIYQTAPQQPPPSYATAVQSSPYSTVVQQPQTQNNNSNLASNNPKPPGTPFSKGYKWPHKSISLVCPQCGASVTTRVENKITIITFIGAVLLFCFTCILVCLPFCIPACKKTIHYCPHCSSVLGVRRELR